MGIRRFLPGLLLGMMIGCAPATEESPALNSSAGAPGLPTATDTVTRTVREPSDTPTPTATKTLLPTDTELPYPTPWPEGFTPTARPTPTRGLAPTATLGVMQSCPPPTQASVSIERLENPADYEQMLLAQLAATGELDAFGEKIKTGDPAADTGDTAVVIFREEVNNDSVEETLISVRQPYEAEDVRYGGVGRPYRTAVFIFGCQGQRYVMLHLLLLDRAEAVLPSGLLAVEDLNGNGVKEIVVSTVENIGNRGNQNLFAKVLEWNGAAFRELLFPDGNDYSSSNTLNAVVEFRDVDGNGTEEILVPADAWPDGAGVDCDLGPGRNSSAVWMWDGDLYQFMWRESVPPQYRFQAAYDGDYSAFLGQYRDAETMYLRAVFDSSLLAGSSGDWNRDGKCPAAGSVKADADEPQKIKAYARFRLVELLVRVGRVLEAQMHWDFLRTNFPIGSPGHIYSYLANAFWWEYVKEEDISAACAAVEREAEKNAGEVFGLFGGYGAGNPGPAADSLCPYGAEE